MMKKNERILKDINTDLINDREFSTLNALDVSIVRVLEKFEFLYQVIAPPPAENHPNIVQVCWEIIDWLERTRKILERGNGIKKKAPECVKILNKLKAVTEFRHFFQHIDNHIWNDDNITTPPLGVVTAFYISSWPASVSEFCIIQIQAGSDRSNKSHANIQIPNKFDERIDYVTLHYSGKSINLSEVVVSLKNYYKILIDQKKAQYKA